MNDAWREATLQEVLKRVSGRLSARKARLIACAWARETEPAPGGTRSQAILLAERFADGKASAHELAAARFGGRFQAGHEAWPVCWSPDVDMDSFHLLSRTAAWATGILCILSATPLSEGLSEAETRLAHIIRDIVHESCRPVSIPPALKVWTDGTVVKLARSIYDERAYDQMPILGDALEEAGCADQGILDHCRAEQSHVRGCWALDAVLGMG
jgi:hypothetical protein